MSQREGRIVRRVGRVYVENVYSLSFNAWMPSL